MGDLNKHNLKDYIDKYNLINFVETGTGIGTGLSYAAKFNFKNLYSIEIIEDLHKKNIEKFKNDDRCKLFNENSLVGLKKILNEINGETLFWLDAHFPGVDFQLGNYDDDYPVEIKNPLEDELKIINKNKDTHKDVFIIDDLGLYEDGNFQLSKDKLKELRKKFNLKLDFLYNTISKTHDIEKDYRHQGFLICLPKIKDKK